MTSFRAIGLSLSVPLTVSLTLGLASWSASAASGLLPPASDTLWPSLQARIAVQTTPSSALSLTGLSSPRTPGGVQGAAVFGDYYFARPSFGGFRATSGLLVGAQGGMPQLSADAGTRLGLAVSNAAVPWLSQQAGSDGLAALPYLGVGFSSQAAGAGTGGWSLSADLGLVAEGVGAVGSLRRALGVQGVENTRRELRLSPLLQVGWRYSF
jgi:hypothetical protein